MNNIMKLLKNYLFYFIVLLFLEIVFILVMPISITLEGVINRLLFTFGLLYSIQCVFYNSFKTYFALSNLGLSDQVADFMDEAFKLVFNNLIYILIFMLPFLIYLILKKKINLIRNNKYNYVVYLGIMVIFISVFIGTIYSSKGKIHGTYELYNDVNEVSLNINKLGVMNSYTIDLYRTIFGFKEKIVNVDIDKDNKSKSNTKSEEVVYKPNTLELDFDKETNNESIKKINEYMKSISGSMKNKYTGMFKGYNLIYITAESFSEIGVSEELTPTLYKLTHSGFIFDNYYTPNALSTIGGEFQSLTGLFPDNSILPTWKSGTNYFPYGLGTTFKNLGYTVHAYHNHNYYFQNRHVYYESQGLTPFKACKNGLENQINCHIWPESDIEMMNVTFDEYKDTDGLFFTYYMTVSGHFEYNFKGDNVIAKRHKSEVEHLTNLSEAAQAYVATQIELDKSLELLLNKLEENDLLDNTVIVLLADHYPYELSLNDVNSLSSYVRDDVVEVNHNDLIIWNNKMDTIHIDKPCMSSDVVPTVYNLFGIEFDSRLFTGRDILSDSSGIAIMKNHSWVTDKGTYFANKSKFVGDEDVTEDYIRSINDTVNNRLNIGKLILETNYYDYLFNK